jgi:hypothetical protein
MKTTLHLTGFGLQSLIVESFGTIKGRSAILRLNILVLLTVINAGIAHAVPSYARQTGLSCVACHYSCPELTSFGRMFKLNGYTMTGQQTIESKSDSDRVVRLNLLSSFPLSAMVQASYSNIAKDVPGLQNNSVAFPQQLSVFYAAQVTPHIGTFIQMTYDGQTFGMDNADIRYINHVNLGSKSLTYGLTLNNNPAVQDVWNTSPAWRFPSATSDAAVNPTKSTIIENLGLQVAGLGAYTLYNNLLFAELTLYRSAQQGSANPADSSSMMVINGVAPYWRLALQHQWSDNYVEVGTFGIASNHFIKGISGIKDSFTDIGVDFQFERIMDRGAFTLHTSLISERENRDTSENQKAKFTFNSFKIDGNLYLKNGLGATIGYFATSGKSDPLVGSLTGKPNSNGFIFQIEYLPWYNTKFILQYIAYSKFDGSTMNYDGSGRNARNNNTLYFLVWLNF